MNDDDDTMPLGIDAERVGTLLEELKLILDVEPCNYLLVVQGKANSMMQLSTRILVPRSMEVLQTLAAGIMPDKVDAETKHVLAAVALVIDEQFQKEDDDAPRILLN